MSLYDILAPHYSEIFSLPQTRIDFITSYSLPRNARILDIGCAVGDCAIALAKLDYTLTGIDLNEQMISLALKKAKQEKLPIQFFYKDMLTIDTLKSSPFNLILCLGNTLPHLSSKKDIKTFFLKTFTALTSPGIFIFQILNYDKIILDKKIIFQTKETENLNFKRNYSFRDDNKIDFNVSLVDKKSNNEISETTSLLPLFKDDLMNVLLETGFRRIEVYSDYNRTPEYSAEFATIYVAKKK